MTRFLSIFFLCFVFANTAKAGGPPDELIDALIQVESHGNDNAVGDLGLEHKAYGCLQIRQPYVDDVNERYGTNYKAEDCLGNRELSILIFKRYMERYATVDRLGHQPTYEDIARIHNGGPKGCFDGGAYDKNGNVYEDQDERIKTAKKQAKAKQYWEKKVKPTLASAAN